MRATPNRAARFLFRKKRTKLYLLFNRGNLFLCVDLSFCFCCC